MERDEAQRILEKRTRSYQPMPGFPNFTGRSLEMFKRRSDCILNYCGKNTSYLFCGCNAGYSCFEAVDAGASKVVGMDGSGKCIEQAKMVAIARGYSTERPQFILQDVFKFFNENTEKFDWVIMLMLLHNVLKSHTLKETIALMEKSAEFANKGLIVTSRYKQWCRDGVHLAFPDVPQYIVDNSSFTRYELVPIPLKGNKPDIAFGIPIWAFYKGSS